MPLTIEAIETLARDPGFCRLRVGAQWYGPIRRDDAERLGVTEGGRWTRALAANIVQLMEVAKARRAALSMLARSTLSRERLLERLSARAHDERAAIVALDELVADGWLDDRTASQERATALARRGGMAREALEMTLEKEGFGRYARLAAKRATDGATDVDRAIHEASKAAIARRSAAAIAQHLSRRGFDSDTIERTLSRLGRSLDQLDEA